MSVNPKKNDTTRQLGTVYTRAQVTESSINTDARTVEVVFATETPVLRYDYWEDTKFNEVLVCSSKAVDFSRLIAAGPVLNTHSRYELSDVIGTVENPRIEGGKCICTLRFSKRAEVDGIWQDIQDKILKSVSVGYDVLEYTIDQHKEGEIPTYRATKWIPGEVSVVPIPADINSGTRNKEAAKHNVIIIQNSTRNMPEEVKTDGEVKTTTPPPATTTPPAITTPPAEPEGGERSGGSGFSARQAAEIIKGGRALGLSDDTVTGILESAATVDLARAALFTAKEKESPAQKVGGPGTGNGSVGTEATDKRRDGMVGALVYRLNGTKENRTKAGEFAGMSLIEMGRECLTLAGANTRGMTRREIAMAALNLSRAGGQHSTSDFPIILGNLFNTTLRAAYALQERTFTPFCRKVTAPDFREQAMAQIGDIGAFEEVLEGGEYKATTLSEGVEKWKLKKYGRTLGFTWEMMINDYLGAFTDVTRNFAIGSSQTQMNLVYNLLTSNPKMADGKNLFSSDHGNLATTGTDISIEAVSAAIVAFRNQKSLAKNPINIYPKFIIVGPLMELKALQFVSPDFTAQNNGTINVYKGLFTVIVDPRITDKSWYMSADPAMIDTIIYGFLEGEEELYTEQRTNFDKDSEDMKARLVFGVKAIEYRGLYKNNGPA